LSDDSAASGRTGYEVFAGNNREASFMVYPLERSEQKWSYADYLTWPEGERWELIDGVAYAMSPAPGRRHQYVQASLLSSIFLYLKGKPCQVYGSPFDVRLAEQGTTTDDSVYTVVQPDIVVVCDKEKLDDRGCNGAPDLIIEITSPTTGKMDLTVKFDLYEKYGVKEYWIVHPEEKTVMVFKLLNGRYGVPERYADTDKITVTLLGELVVDLAEIFGE